MPTEKRKTVVVNVNGSELKFRFYPVYDREDDPEQLFCDTCKLSELCGLIPDPRNPGDAKSTFTDFCGASGNLSDQESLSSDKYENLLPEVADVVDFTRVIGSDLYQKIVEKDPYVRLSEVIDCMCGEGGYPCPMYNKEHTKCHSSNRNCVLNNLFKSNK